MREIEAFIYSTKVAPYCGWHDDHRERDGTPTYLPAMQHVRSEFEHLMKMIGMWGGMHSCLQLGLGPSRASHPVWGRLFSSVTTIDLAMCITDEKIYAGANTHDRDAVQFAELSGPYDFLFVDAGHSYDDVRADYENYRPMVRAGGLIAFHDALPRERYPEVKVHDFVKNLPVMVIGDEVGTAVMEVK